MDAPEQTATVADAAQAGKSDRERLRGEVLCPNCGALAPRRVHGVVRRAAVIGTLGLLWLPLWVFDHWRGVRSGDTFQCTICSHRFLVHKGQVGFQAGIVQLTAVPLADRARGGAGAGRVILVLLAIVVVGIAVWTVVRLSSQRNVIGAEPTLVASQPTPAPAQATFEPFWVRNFEITDMWSGPVDQPGVTSFSKTSAQFCAFLVIEPQQGSRLHVLNPYSNNYLWLDAASVGPASPPETRPGDRSADQNCSDADVR